MQEIPVYLFNGLLESGKTTFIEEILGDPDFTDSEVSLLFLCEQGEMELDEEFLKNSHTVVVPVEDESQLSLAYFRQCVREINPDRVLIEFNGMWSLPDFLEHKLPPEWLLYQIVNCINAQTFELYSNNLGQRMFEQITMADLIVFNRCDDALKDMLHKRNIRAMNPRATIFLDDCDGNSEDYMTNMEMPFDIDAPVITITDDDFGLWYVDASSSPEKYEGKTVKFKGMAHRSEHVEKDEFVPGRFAMICCDDDITFVGFICRGADMSQITDKSWYEITAEIHVEELEAYRGEGPVLYCRNVAAAQPPAEEVVQF